MSSLDLFVVNVAFDDIGSDLGVGIAGGPTAADLSWVLNAYAVMYAALLVPFGRLAPTPPAPTNNPWGVTILSG